MQSSARTGSIPALNALPNRKQVLLVRLHRRNDNVLMVLERPEIPLHTNASENDLRACVTKRRISGGTMSADGREARDVMIGLMKTAENLASPSSRIWVTGSASMN